LTHHALCSSFQTKTATIAADISAQDLQTLIHLEFGLTEALVTRTDSCRGWDYNVQWTRSSGDQVALQVDGTNLAGRGEVAIALIENDGHVFYDPIPGELLRTQEAAPQVVVKINNIVTK